MGNSNTHFILTISYNSNLNFPFYYIGKLLHTIGNRVLYPFVLNDPLPTRKRTATSILQDKLTLSDYEGNKLDIHRHVRPPKCRPSLSSCDLDRFYPSPSEVYRHMIVQFVVKTGERMPPHPPPPPGI